MHTRRARVHGSLDLMHSTSAICIDHRILWCYVKLQQHNIYHYLSDVAVISFRVTIHGEITSSRFYIYAENSINVSNCVRHVVGCHVMCYVGCDYYMFCVFVDRRDSEDTLSDKHLPK